MSKYDPTGSSDEAEYTKHLATVSGIIAEATSYPTVPFGYIAGLTGVQKHLKEAHRNLGTDAQWEHTEAARQGAQSIFAMARKVTPRHFAQLHGVSMVLGNMLNQNRISRGEQ